MYRVKQDLIYDRYDPPVTRHKVELLVEGLIYRLISQDAYAIHLKRRPASANLYDAYLRKEQSSPMELLVYLDYDYIDPIIGLLLIAANLPFDPTAYPEHEEFEFSLLSELRGKRYRIPIRTIISPQQSRHIVLRRPTPEERT